MSYKNISEDDFLSDLTRRKEFYSLKSDPARNFRDPPDSIADPFANKYLKIHSYQLFVRNFMNPNTDKKRLHLMWSAGLGKSLGAVTIAQEFIRVYKKMYAMSAAKVQATRRNYADLDKSSPTVFVLGFGGTKGAFIRELLKYPEFGFISQNEKDELVKRQKIADAGLPDDIKHLKEYYSGIKKRITNKSRDGFYKFFGYDEFVNRLFLTDDVKLTDLESIAIQKLKSGEHVTLEDIFYQYIKSGKIQVNTTLMSMFENSLLICDEIHNTYNMNMKNNRGVAIQYILESVPSMRFLSLSATPINNSPTEIVELINYLVPKDKKVTKRGLFINSRTLHPGKLDEIGHILRGYVSFMQDANIKYFPKRIFMGDSLEIPTEIEQFRAGSIVPYLKFIKCPMSELHQATYINHLETATQSDIPDDESEMLFTSDLEQPEYPYHTIPTDGYTIYDMVFPNPENDTIGLFRSSDVKNKISIATQEWKDKNKIKQSKFSAINNIISGDFLLKDNIGVYSTKYKTLIDLLYSIIGESGDDPNKCQKIMIYHDKVKMSGVLLIQELLKTNDIIDEHGEPTDKTICCICGKKLSEHSTNHVYHPARFIMAHSDIDKIVMDQSLAKYNAPDNSHGLNYMILIGSRKIKESYDFKDIQNIIYISLPTNIPTFIQVLGRCIRKHSHINLPPEQRIVKVRILISTINMTLKHLDSISPEMYKYIDKLLDYIVIQNIEREINRYAIDADIHRDIIMSKELIAEYFPDGKEPISRLGNLYFDPTYYIPQYNLDELNLSTFSAYRYNDEEVKTISYIIKRLFISHPVWTYDDLWAQVKNPPLGIEVNPKLFAEYNFIIALNNLVAIATTIISTSKLSESSFVEKLFDYNERYIYKNGYKCKIDQIDKYYILFPVADLPINPLNTVYMEYTEHIRDKERAMIKEMAEPNDRTMVDVETYLRPVEKSSGIKININAFVNENRININYVVKKSQFVSFYKNLESVDGFLSDYSTQFQMTFLEEAIVYMILGSKVFVNIDAATVLLYKKVIDLLDKFNVIIYLKEVAKYKDTSKQYKHGLPNLDEKTPMGYAAAKSVKLFDPGFEEVGENVEKNGKWLEINKISLNRHTSFKENDIVIGYFESKEDQMQFKLRKPLHKIKEEMVSAESARKIQKSDEGFTQKVMVNDTRYIERGIVCNTKNKHDLLQIIASLGISASKLQKCDIRIRKLCEIIKKKLIENEIKERQRDSKYKWVYNWWDNFSSVAHLL